MLSKSKLKLLQCLKLKKFRQKYNLFQAEGSRLVKTILKQKRYRIEELFYAEGSNLFPSESIHGLKPEALSEKELFSISSLKSSPDAIAIVRIREDLKGDLTNYQHMIYLDDVQDPGNVGTIIRIADWYGIEAVIRSSGSADFYNPKTIQSTMGSFDNVDLISMDRAQFISAKNKIVFCGAEMTGMDLNQWTPKQPLCLIMGNEGQGLSPELKAVLDFELSIRGAQDRSADSLNVAVATGIFCSKLFPVNS